MRLTWSNFVKQLALFSFSLILVLSIISCSGENGDNSENNITPGTEDETLKDGWITGSVEFGDDDIHRVLVEGTMITAISIQDNVANQSQEIEDLASFTYTTTVDSTGKYLLRVLEGKYAVMAEGISATKAFANVVVAAGESTVYDFKLTAVATVKGQISHAGFGLGSQIILTGANISTTCNKSGEFIFNNIPIGYHVFGIISGYSYSSYGTFSAAVVPGLNDLGVITDLKEVPVILSPKGNDLGTIPPSMLDTFEIHFSTSMKEESTQSAITITADSEVKDISYEWYYSTRSLKINNLKEKLGDYYGPVTISVSNEAVAMNEKRLLKTYSFSFIVGETIIKTIPENSYQYLYILDQGPSSGLSQLEVWFSDDINTQTFDFEITPPLMGGVELEWKGQDENISTICLLKGIFEEGTEYTVRINNASTVSGITIADLPYTFSFKTSTLIVTNTSPDNGATGVPIEREVRLMFNARMDRDAFENCLAVTNSDTGKQLIPEDIQWELSFQNTDNVYIQLPFSYGNTYTLDLINVKSMSGAVLDTFSMSFATLIPQLTHADHSSYNSAVVTLDFNTDIYWNQSNFSLISVSDGSSVNFEVSNGWSHSGIPWGIDDRIYIKAVDGLSPNTMFQVVWNGLNAIDYDNSYFPLDDGMFEFTTPPIKVLKTSPSFNARNVPRDQHSFSIRFSGAIAEDLKQIIQNAITITAFLNSTSETLTPVIFWDNSYDGNLILYLDFIFNYSTQYIITVDTSINSELEILFKNRNTFEFIVENDPDDLPAPDLFKEFIIDSDNIIHNNYHGWHLGIEFNYWVDLNEYPFSQVVQIRDANGTLVPISSGYADPNYNTKIINGRTCSKYWNLENLPLDYGRQYSITLTDNIIFFDDGRTPDINLPATLNVKTESPDIHVTVDNDMGKIRINTAYSSGEFSFSRVDAVAALSTVPFVTFTVIEPEDPGEIYVKSLTLQYSPVTTAHIQVTLNKLMAYRQNSSGSGDGHDPICYFGNTPYAHLFTIDPDAETPKLTTVYAGGNNQVRAVFSTSLDAQSANDVSNYSVIDDSGTSIPILDVALTRKDNSEEANNGYDGPVKPEISILIDGVLVSGEMYTLTVNNITEWGGHFVIPEGHNAATFQGYNGVLQEVHAYDYMTWVLVSENFQRDYSTIALIVFDVPVDTDDAEDKIQIQAYQGGSYNDFTPSLIEWNTDDSAVVFMYESDNDISRIKLTFTGTIQNLISGNSVYIDDYTKILYVSYQPFSLSCYIYGGITSRIDVRYTNSDTFPEHYDVLTNYTLSNDTSGVSVPDINTMELVGGSSNRVYLHLSSDLADTGTHLLTATGLVDPNLDKFGLGAITPEIGDTF